MEKSLGQSNALGIFLHLTNPRQRLCIAPIFVLRFCELAITQESVVNEDAA